jgi:hypothetical protein
MKELKATRSMRLNKDIRILQVHKGKCTAVLEEFKYKDKFNTLLHSGVNELLIKDPTANVERKVKKLLSKHKTSLMTDLKRKFTPYHSKPSNLYGLPKVHKPDIPLRPLVSSISSPCYALAGFLHKILSLLVAKSESFFKNSSHFVQLLKTVNLQSLDILISSNVPVNDGMAMGALYHQLLATSTWSILRNWLNLAQHKPSLWLRYIDDTFVVWLHGPE